MWLGKIRELFFVSVSSFGKGGGKNNTYNRTVLNKLIIYLRLKPLRSVSGSQTLFAVVISTATEHL